MLGLRTFALIGGRLIVAALVIGALALWPRIGAGGVAAGLGLAAAAYGLFARVRAWGEGRGGWPAGYRYGAVSAVILPDWMGFLWGGVLIALPLWAGRAGEGLHPSAVLTWPLGAAFLALSGIAARRAGVSLRLTPEGLESLTLLGGWRIDFDEIAEIRPWRRDLPGWVRALGAAAGALGNPTAAGAVMLARPSSGLEIGLKSGARRVIPGDAFEAATGAILRAAAARGVALAPGLAP